MRKEVKYQKNKYWFVTHMSIMEFTEINPNNCNYVEIIQEHDTNADVPQTKQGKRNGDARNHSKSPSIDKWHKMKLHNEWKA